MAYIDKSNPMFDALANFKDSINFGELSFYYFSVINNESCLVQSQDSGYYPMEVVDSALTSGNSRIFDNGGKVIREENKLSFILPKFYKSAFIIVNLNSNAAGAGVTNWYNRIMFEYGTNTPIELARNAISGTGLDHRRTDTMIAFQGGRWPVDDSDGLHKFVIQSYGEQSYFGCNVLIGVM